jgi:hypothetical protein
MTEDENVADAMEEFRNGEIIAPGDETIVEKDSQRRRRSREHKREKEAYA